MNTNPIQTRRQPNFKVGDTVKYIGFTEESVITDVSTFYEVYPNVTGFNDCYMYKIQDSKTWLAEDNLQFSN